VRYRHLIIGRRLFGGLDNLAELGTKRPRRPEGGGEPDARSAGIGIVNEIAGTRDGSGTVDEINRLLGSGSLTPRDLVDRGTGWEPIEDCAEFVDACRPFLRRRTLIWLVRMLAHVVVFLLLIPGPWILAIEVLPREATSLAAVLCVLGLLSWPFAAVGIAVAYDRPRVAGPRGERRLADAIRRGITRRRHLTPKLEDHGYGWRSIASIETARSLADELRDERARILRS
jgi:hypothetical protein